MADSTYFIDNDAVHNEFDQLLLDVMEGLQNHSMIYITGGCRSGKSTILCELYSRLRQQHKVVLTSNNTRSIIAMKKFCISYSAISRKVDKTIKYLLVDNVNMMTTSKFKYIMQMYPLAKVVVTGNPLYTPNAIDMSIVSTKWKIFIIKSYYKLDVPNSVLAHPLVKLVKGACELEKYNKSYNSTTFRSIDTAYLMKSNGARLEVESNNTSDYLDMLIFTQQILIIGVGDVVLFKSTWMGNYNELGIVKEISKDCVKVETQHGVQNVYRVEEEGRSEANVVVVRKQFPIVLANAIDITDMEGLYLGRNVKICRTNTWSAGDIDYAMSHSGIGSSETMISYDMFSTSTPIDPPRIQITCVGEDEGSTE